MNSSRPKGEVFRRKPKAPPVERVKRLPAVGDSLWWIYTLPRGTRDALPVRIIAAKAVSSHVAITSKRFSGRNVVILNTNLVLADVATAWCTRRK